MRGSIEAVADVRQGAAKGRDFHGRETVKAPYLHVANVQDGYLDLSEIKEIDVQPSELEKYHLERGDVLLTEGGDPDKLGRGFIWNGEIQGCIYQNHIFRVRVDRRVILPEFLAFLTRTQYAKMYFLKAAKRSSNLASINASQLRAFLVPLPPIGIQERFRDAFECNELTTIGRRDTGPYRSHVFEVACRCIFRGSRGMMARANWCPRKACNRHCARRDWSATREVLLAADAK